MSVVAESLGSVLPSDSLFQFSRPFGKLVSSSNDPDKTITIVIAVTIRMTTTIAYYYYTNSCTSQ